MVASKPVIREIKIDDVEGYIELRKELDKQTKFLLMEPGERNVRFSEIKKQIKTLLSCENQTIFVIEDNSAIVGFLSAIGGRYKRNAKTVFVVIGILEEYSGNGLGTALFERMEDWARSLEVHRLELIVMTHNTRGIALYQKMGFEIEGMRKDCLIVDGKYVHEYVMAKIID